METSRAVSTVEAPCEGVCVRAPFRAGVPSTARAETSLHNVYAAGEGAALNFPSGHHLTDRRFFHNCGKPVHQ